MNLSNTQIEIFFLLWNKLKKNYIFYCGTEKVMHKYYVILIIKCMMYNKFLQQYETAIQYYTFVLELR